jgi:hypothetical protein
MDNTLDWRLIFAKRPELNPPGYEEAAADAKLISAARYERLGKKRAGSSGRSRDAAFPSLKHGSK